MLITPGLDTKAGSRWQQRSGNGLQLRWPTRTRDIAQKKPTGNPRIVFYGKRSICTSKRTQKGVQRTSALQNKAVLL